MAAIFVIPAWLMRSIAPIHNSISGLIGFLIKIGISTPRKASAISCTTNGLTVERAPIQRISIPAFKQSSTCCAVATSTALFMLFAFAASASHCMPLLPKPVKEPGRVLGFQIPPRKTGIW